MSTQLVQITDPQNIPPLHQSTEQLTACPTFYVAAIIKRKKQPGGMESARGNQVHKAGAAYAAWCAHKGVDMDLDAFDRFAEGAGPAASKILTGMRETYRVDHAHLLATEVPMSLDHNFDPTDVLGSLEGICGDSGLPSHYSGILDTLYAFQEAASIQVDDLKTHPRPYDPADPDKALQGKMYALFCFKHFPWVMEVRFRLVFVRYHNLIKEVTYTREDVPKLIETVKAARARQLMIHRDHQAGNVIEAIPGAHCVYCPLLANLQCPIAEFNPQMQLTPEQRLKFHLWYAAFSAANNKALKDHLQGTGRNIVLKDYNGKAYVYGPDEKESKLYPLFKATGNGIATDPQGNPVMPIVSLLMDYAHATPEDTKWMGQLAISSTKLNSYLGTKRRAFLDQACQDTADKVTKVRLKVSKPADSIEEEEQDEDQEAWEDDEF